MQRTLTQEEIDTLIDALNTVKSYGNTNIVSADILKNQVVLTQPEIDSLIESLNVAKGEAAEFKVSGPDVNVVLSQSEIDSLIDALNVIKQYDGNDDITIEIDHSQTVLTQAEIDKLIDALLTIKTHE